MARTHSGIHQVLLVLVATVVLWGVSPVTSLYFGLRQSDAQMAPLPVWLQWQWAVVALCFCLTILVLTRVFRRPGSLRHVRNTVIATVVYLITVQLLLVLEYGTGNFVDTFMLSFALLSASFVFPLLFGYGYLVSYLLTKTFKDPEVIVRQDSDTDL